MAVEESDSMERSEESETPGGADSMLFICLVLVVNIFVVDGDTNAYDADGSRRSLAVAATNVTGKIFVVVVVVVVVLT
jgi:hypothetical protein